MKKLQKLQIILITILTLFSCSNRVDTSILKNDKQLSKKEVFEDVDLLIKNLEDIHPNPYYHLSRVEFTKEIGIIKSDIGESIPSILFLKKILPPIVKLNDGHTRLDFDPIVNFIKDNDINTFPLELEIRNNRAFILKNLSSYIKITDGSEVLKINGIPTETIINSLMKYVLGENIKFKEYILEETFQCLFWLEYFKTDSFKIEYKSNNKIKRVTLDGVKLYKHNVKYYTPSNYTYKFLTPEICYLDFNSFTDYSTFEKMLNVMFKEIRESSIQNLIIDVRGNGGGNSSLGDLLFSHIYNKPFYQFSDVKEKISKQVGNSYGNSDLIGTIRSYNFSQMVQLPNKQLYDGRVVLLTDRYTFSSASAFSTLLKDFGRGIIIGEETGGLPTSYGDIFMSELPHSKFSYAISHKYFIRPNGKKEINGLMPHIEVYENTLDRAEDKDTTLTYAQDFILKEYDDYIVNITKTAGKDIIPLSNKDIQYFTSRLEDILTLIFNNDIKINRILKNKLSSSQLEIFSNEMKRIHGMFNNIEYIDGYTLLNDSSAYTLYFNVIGVKSVERYFFKVDKSGEVLELRIL